MSLAEVRRGINLVGMEGLYGEDGADPDGERWDNAHGPRRGKDYPIYSQDLIRYYRDKNIAVVRLLFSWERLQSALAGPIPGNGPGYADYFSDFVDLVDFMTSLDIVVIVEPWQAGADGGAGGLAWRGRPVGSAGVPIAAFVDLWAKLAGLFKANPRVEYGLVNEPHDMSTMDWWSIAQQCVDQIRASGANSTIYVPGNGYSAASTWTEDFYDTAVPARSNAYGWLNAKAVGQSLTDPLARTVAEVHLYLDADAGGSTTQIGRPTIARERLTVAVEEAAAN